MVVVEDLKTSIILKSIGAKSEWTQLRASIPAATTVTITYTPPTGYAWFKYDVRYGNNVPQMGGSVYVDETVEYTDIYYSEGYAYESYRCLAATIVYNKLTMKVINSDVVSHDVDVIVRGFLIVKGDVPKLLDELRKISLSDETIDKLATKIAEKISAKERRRRG